MYIYKKIAKKKKITYYICKSTAKSKTYNIKCDFSKSGISGLEYDFETVVAWIDKNSKSITWDADYSHIIDAMTIRMAVINLLIN